MADGMDLVWGWTDEDEARFRQQMGLAARPRVNLRMQQLFREFIWWFHVVFHVTGLEALWTLYKLKLGGAMAAG